VPILPSFVFETQVHGGTAPVLLAVAALPAAVKTTISTSSGPAIAYVTSTNKPVYAVVLANKACLFPPIIAKFDISGQPMVANPGAIYDLGSIPLRSCT
jgi:hypothetical protein